MCQKSFLFPSCFSPWRYEIWSYPHFTDRELRQKWGGNYEKARFWKAFKSPKKLWNSQCVSCAFGQKNIYLLNTNGALRGLSLLTKAAAEQHPKHQIPKHSHKGYFWNFNFPQWKLKAPVLLNNSLKKSTPYNDSNCSSTCLESKIKLSHCFKASEKHRHICNTAAHVVSVYQGYHAMSTIHVYSQNAENRWM